MAEVEAVSESRAPAVLPLADQIAAVLRGHQWTLFAGDPVAWLAAAVKGAICDSFGHQHTVQHSLPLQVDGVMVTVTTADARRRAAVRATLLQRALHDDVDAQVLVATAGAGVGHPGVIGGKPCALVYLTLPRQEAR